MSTIEGDILHRKSYRKLSADKPNEPKIPTKKHFKMFGEDVLFKLHFRYIVYFCTGLPLLGFVLCVYFALWLHFEGSTRTHCGVANYLPSISAAIGDYTPERYIWRVCISLHSVPRFMISWCYKNYYLMSPLRPIHTDDLPWYNMLCYLVCCLHWVENSALIALTYVSSTENHNFHETAFITFTVAAIMYMLLTLYMFHVSGRRRTSSKGEKSFQYKTLIFLVNIGALLASVYFFYRHNTYCEPGIYTFFAACEYVVVLTNIAFHGTVHMDFTDKVISVITATANVDSLDLEWKST